MRAWWGALALVACGGGATDVDVPDDTGELVDTADVVLADLVADTKPEEGDATIDADAIEEIDVDAPEEVDSLDIRDSWDSSEPDAIGDASVDEGPPRIAYALGGRVGCSS